VPEFGEGEVDEGHFEEKKKRGSKRGADRQCCRSSWGGGSSRIAGCVVTRQIKVGRRRGLFSELSCVSWGSL
jgi:hypothetical protein